MNKKLLAVAVSGALATPMAAQAVKYKLSGQVNRAIVYNDDGKATDVQFVDNISSGTRWRMNGSEDIGNGMKVGFSWEWQVSSNPSNPGLPIKSSDGPNSGSQSMRKAEVWFSGNWGKVSIGQGDGAGNGTTEHDLSDTWNVTYYGRTSFGAATAWRTGAAGTIGLTHGNTFSEFDAFSRYDRVRYDTPALGPVTAAVSYGQQSQFEVAARLNIGLAGGQLSGGVFWGKSGRPGRISDTLEDLATAVGLAGISIPDISTDSRYGGSVAYLFSQGTNISIAGAQDEADLPSGVSGIEDTASTWYVKLGHKWGNNAVSIAYGESEDVVPGFTDSGFQIGFNHNIPKAKVDIYAGYHSNELDVASSIAGVPVSIPSVDDITAFVVGTKLKFD